MNKQDFKKFNYGFKAGLIFGIVTGFFITAPILSVIQFGWSTSAVLFLVSATAFITYVLSK